MMSDLRPRRRRRPFTLVMLLIVAGALPSSTGQAYEATDDLPTSGPVRVVGKIPVNSPQDRDTPNTYWSTGEAPLVVDPIRRRGYQFFRIRPDGQDVGTGIRLIDLDTFKPLRYATLPNMDLTTYTGGRAASKLPHAVDLATGAVFFVTDANRIPIIDPVAFERGDKNFLKGVLQAPVSQQTLQPRDLLPPAISGMTLYRSEGSLKMILQFTAESKFHLVQWDIDRYLAGQDWGDWSTPLGRGVAECSAAPSSDRSQNAILLAPDRSSVVIACGGTDLVRVHLGSLGPTGLEEVFGGPELAIATLVDPAANRFHVVSERTSLSNIESSHDLWTFDNNTGRWVGRAGVTLGATQDSFGIDTTTGRIYALAPDTEFGGALGAGKTYAPGGLMMIDSRLTPVPQPLLFPEFSYPSVVPIQVMPASVRGPTRIIMRRSPTYERNLYAKIDPPPSFYPRYPDGRMVELKAEQHWLAIDEEVPLAVDSPLGQRDVGTVDVAERPGITQATFEASAGAYATRLRMVRGFASATSGGGGYGTRTPVFYPHDPACWRDGRLFTTGWAEDASLSNGQSSARAAPVVIDGVTAEDLSAPTSRCQPPDAAILAPQFQELDRTLFASESAEGRSANPLNEVYNRTRALHQVSCVRGTGAGSDEVSDNKAVADRHNASVECQDGEAAPVKAEAESAAGAGDVQVAASRSSVRIERDPERGVVVRSESWVRGVRVPVPGADLYADLIRSEAEAWSFGRPSAEPRTTYTRTICGLRVGNTDKSPCYTEVHDASCRGKDLVAALGSDDDFSKGYRNHCEHPIVGLAGEFAARSGARFRIRAPDPAPDFRQGSPGGYIAGIQKGAAEQFDDALLNGDASYEVPALEIVVEREEGRQIVQLAAVRAISAYGIGCMPPLVYLKALKRCVQPAGFDGSFPLPGDPASPDLPQAGLENGPELLAARAPAPAGFDQVPAAGIPPIGRGGRTWRALLVRSAGEGALATTVWLAILLPTMLATRRKAALGAIESRAQI